MRRRERPGLQPVGHLSQELRAVLEPVVDLLARVIGVSGLAKLKDLATFATGPLEAPLTAALLPAATLAQVITKVNELQVAIEELRATVGQLQDVHNETQLRVNAIIDRLQED